MKTKKRYLVLKVRRAARKKKIKERHHDQVCIKGLRDWKKLLNGYFKKNLVPATVKA